MEEYVKTENVKTENVKTENVKTENVKTENNNTHIYNGNVWVEKWRPTNFDGIVLDPLNKQILKNIIKLLRIFWIVRFYRRRL